MNLPKIVKSSIVFVSVFILLLSGIGCQKKAATPAPVTQVATVERGDLTVTTSVDGNLVMPQAYNLLFGAPGTVQNVYVQEGDVVKEGTILATLDNTSQRLSVESSNNNVQVVLSKLYENVPTLPQFPSFLNTNPATSQPDYVQADARTAFTYYYPNGVALSAYDWARDEINQAEEYFQSDNYTAASSQLYLAVSDLEATIQVLQYAMNDPKSGLGNMASLVPTDEAGIAKLSIEMDNSWEIPFIVQLRNAINTIKQAQTDTGTLRGLITQDKYSDAEQMFPQLIKQVKDIAEIIYNNINVIKTHNYSTIYGQDISNYFYNAAGDKISASLKGIEAGGLNAAELNDNLLIADHYMRICNSILGSNDYVLQHGLSLKNDQQYHVDLQNALTGLANSQQDFLKTVILAPFDGTVVSVGVKKNDVLSQIDYASVTAVQLVDTSQIKFQGKVDEIDILKIKASQKASISVDAVPNRRFTGKVTFISPFGTPDTNGVVKFPVTILLDPTDVSLKGGLTATADIAETSIENTLLVPLAAVTTSSSGSSVTVIDQATGQQEVRQVTIGSQNFQFDEVLSGLKEGDKVVIQENVAGAPVVKGFPTRSITPGR